ncbi:chromosomal replication initiator protein DnaA [Plastoroseomonas arctica]|uniref:Chromosomal replication initiator protein DnaA n=1 Tax=Plastoroseomonas arctica TaxID=1509237 RepID=A0AAF1K6F8_9PROT|nr:chromosomal replication initiator protein DnaA [Plastoroseomonas arctica]MBR0657339.1 chromosomal replication initiator protein DnaA [Plastoroseomonas arctica]
MEKDVDGATPVTSVPQLAESWARVRGRLREDVGEVEYRSWLKQMTLAGIEGDEAIVLLPTRFLRDWVRGHYGDRLRALWQMENPAIRRVDVRVAAAARPAAGEPVAEAAADGLAETLAPRPENRPGAKPDARVDWSAPLETRFTFDTFIVGKPNEFAYACARRVAEKPAIAGFNPLFLYGGVGLGKTHLMHSIAWTIRESSHQRSITYMTAEKFMGLFIVALRSQSTMEFKEILRGVDVLMIDDLQFLIGKDNTQEEFFHTFNALIGAGKQIVVSADKSPSDLNGLDDRLRGRLGGGMVADLHATTYELRLSILEAKASGSGVAMNKRVLEFLAHKITSNVRDIEGALNRLIGHANLFGREITLETAQEVLKDMLRAHDRRLTIEEIQKRVAEHYNIRLTDMSSARRARNVARPRQVAMYLAKKLTQRSLPEIGRRFGNRDHTTVMHAVSRVAELMQGDAGFAEDVELLQRMLEVS